MSQISVTVPHHPALLALAAAFLLDVAKQFPESNQYPTPTLQVFDTSNVPETKTESAALATFTPDMQSADDQFAAEMAEAERTLALQIASGAALPTPSSDPVVSPFYEAAEVIPPPPPVAQLQSIPPPPPAAAPVVIPPPPPPVEETEDDRLIGEGTAYTFAQWLEAKWTEESLIASGKMKPKSIAVPAAGAAPLANADTAPTATSGTVVNITPPPPQTTAASATPTNDALDSDGLPWDRRIHSEGQTKIAKGTWKRKKNVDPSLVATVEAELRALLANAPLAAQQSAAAAIAMAPASVLLPKEVQHVQPPAQAAASAAFMKRIMTALATKALTQAQIIPILNKHGLKTALDLSKPEYTHLIPQIESELFPGGQ